MLRSRDGGKPKSGGGLEGDRLVGILHGCLKTRALYAEQTAWGQRQKRQ